MVAPVVAWGVSSRLVAHEFAGRTQLFLEALPVSRTRVLLVKLLLGFLLFGGAMLAATVLAALVDARHDPSEKDHHMLALLEEAHVPTLVVATKIDKLKQSERKRQFSRIRACLELEDDAIILPFSGVTGTGVRELWGIIDQVLA